MNQSLIPTVWHQGEFAGSMGISQSECPYQSVGEENYYWNEGWKLGVKTFESEKQKLKTIELVKL